VFAFLYAMVDIFKGYFEEDFDEDSIRDNFTLVYELLDGERGGRCCEGKQMRSALQRQGGSARHGCVSHPLSTACLLACLHWPPSPQRSLTTGTLRTAAWTCSRCTSTWGRSRCPWPARRRRR